MQTKTSVMSPIHRKAAVTKEIPGKAWARMWVEDHWTSLSWTGTCANSRGDKRNVYPPQIKNGGPSKHTISFKSSLVCWWVPWGFTGAWERYLKARECLKHRGVTSKSQPSAEDDSGKLQTSSPASVFQHNLTTAPQQNYLQLGETWHGVGGGAESQVRILGPLPGPSSSRAR